MIYASRLGNIAFTIFIVVIVSIAISFSLVYFLYGKYKKENIKTGNEDDDIKKDLKRKLYQKGDPKEKKKKEKEEPEPEVQPQLGSYTVVDGKKIYEATFADVDLPDDTSSKKKKKQNFDLVPRVPYSERLVIYQKKKKRKEHIMDVVFYVFAALMLAVMIIGIIFKANNQDMKFGGNRLLTIQSNSMETMYEKNTYLVENNLNGPNNRIEKYALIGISDVANDKQIKLYDIVAYKDNDGNTIVHRVIKINEVDDFTEEGNIKLDSNGNPIKKRTFNLRGDANSGSMPIEINLPFEKIEGKFNGFKSLGIGITLSCLQSNIGIIAMVAAIAFLLAYNLCEASIDKSYDKREVEVAKRLDERPWEN